MNLRRMGWESALEQLLKRSYAGLERAQVGWAVIGSVASALQGCRVSPRDIDILVIKPEHVHHFAGLMSADTPASCNYAPDDGENWFSSQAYPVHSGPDDFGFTWHFARWLVEGYKVEVAHISPPEGFRTADDGAGIWEAGPEIWPYLRQVPFAGYQVPVVPLEIQLQTSLARGLQERVEAIITVLREKGYDHALAKRSLSAGHQEVLQTVGRNYFP